MYIHLCINEFLSEAGFLELTDFGQFWQNQEISWENAVFLQEISWYLISCFPARKCATLVPMQILMLYLKISRNMQNTYYLPRASSNRPPFIIFPSINPFSVFMIHCDLVIPGIKGAFKDQKAHSFTRPILVSRRTYSRVIVDAATTLILKIRPHFARFSVFTSTWPPQSSSL